MTGFEFISTWVRSRRTGSERGASLVEYALLLALIAIVCIVAVATLGTGLSDSFDDSGQSIFGG